jgi:hypothetical protein
MWLGLEDHIPSPILYMTLKSVPAGSPISLSYP